MKKIITIILAAAFLISCGGDDKKVGIESSNNDASSTQSEVTKEEPKEKVYDPMTDLGIGPVESIFLGKYNEELAATGKEAFKVKCSSCHKMSKKFIGPALEGILDRRTPEWVMNMILNPEEMVEKNQAAKTLFEEYLSPMANQNLTEEEARAILEHFRTIK